MPRTTAPITTAHLAAITLAATLVAVSHVSGQQFQFTALPQRAPVSALPPLAPLTGGIAFADLDGGGLQDAVACNAQGVWAFWRQHDGSFVTTQTHVQAPGCWPVLRDLDGDGDLDVFLAPQTRAATATIEVLRGQNNRWSLALQVALGSQTVVGGELGDVDGDGDPDLVVTQSSATDAVVLRRNQGGGTLSLAIDRPATPAVVTPGLWPRLGDLDGDGDPDFLGSRPDTGFVLLRNVGGTFVDATASLPTTGPGYVDHRIGDFDGDGRADVAATAANGDIDMLWGTGAGFVFQPALAVILQARALLAVDLEGDGDLDLVVERPGVGIDVLRNDGARSFVRVTAVDRPVATFDVGDYEGDGTPDLVFRTVARPEIVEVQPRAAFAAPDTAMLALPALPAPITPVFPVAADFDNDGHLDLALAGGSIYLGGGDGTWRQRTELLPPMSRRPIPFDVDGDGDLDLVANTGAIAYCRNDGGGHFAAAVAIAPLSGSSNAAFDVGDLNGDGLGDVVVANGFALQVIRNRGAAGFAAPLQFAASLQPGAVLALADLDGDGDLDLATGALDATARCAMFRNDGLGNLTPAFPAVSASFPDAVATTDIDGDGDVDVVFWGTTTRIWANNGAGSLTDVSALSGLSLTQQSARLLADLDGDGAPDLMDTGTGRILHNDGHGHFAPLSPARLDPAVSLAEPYQAIDLDADGDVDLVGEPIVVNMQRQIVVPTAPRLGGVLQVDVISGPGFSPTGTALLGAATAQQPRPLRIPGFEGALQLDFVSLTIVAAVPTSSIGVSTAFVPVPANPALFGLPVWLQALVVPQTGAPGFTNCGGETLR